MTQRIALQFDDSVDSVRAQNVAEELRHKIEATGTKVALDGASAKIGVVRLELRNARHLNDLRRMVNSAAEKYAIHGNVSLMEE